MEYGMVSREDPMMVVRSQRTYDGGEDPTDI
jgi:hypothetical protein